jgi:hypothetical protein
METGVDLGVFLFPWIFLTLVMGGQDPSQCPLTHREISIPVEIPRAERGPKTCPLSYRVWLKNLSSPESSLRAEARTRLSSIHWRHLSWLIPMVETSPPELRLSLLQIAGRLRRARYSL